MTPSDTSPQPAFAALVTRFLSEPDVEEGKAFHAPALKARGKIFAMLVQDRLVVKLPADRCTELVTGGSGVPFESGRRKMREWVSAGEPDEGRWLALAEEALAFARR